MVQIQDPCTGSRIITTGNSGRIPTADIRVEFDRLVEASVSENTHETYRKGIDCFESFRNEYDLVASWPPPLSHVTTFIAFLSLSKKSHSTVSTYISAINFKCKMSQFVDFANNFLVRKMLEGMRRTNKKKDTRLPISRELLHKIINALPLVCTSNFEAALFSSAFSIAFHGFLRVGEIAMNKPCQLKQIITINNTDLCLDGESEMIKLRITYSKADQHGKGSIVHIRANGEIYCPVHLLKKYLAMRPKVPGPLYCHFGGKPITRYQFASLLNKTLKFLGIDSSHIRTHSFRIGAASTHYENGTSYEDIQRLGRWSSDTFKRYIRC